MDFDFPNLNDNYSNEENAELRDFHEKKVEKAKKRAPYSTFEAVV